jgi:uncharacterized membrane protein SpoIIM required for sporulation
VARDLRWADALGMGMVTAQIEDFVAGEAQAGEWFAETAYEAGNSTLSAALWTNNASVALKGFAFGITAGLGTLAVLWQNMIMLGVFLGTGTQLGAFDRMLAVVAPHGFLEILCIILAAGAGFVIAQSILDPGDWTRAQSLALGAREAIKMAVGILPWLLLAALIEGYLSPQTIGLMGNDLTRILVGVAVAVLAIALLFAGDYVVAGWVVPETRRQRRRNRFDVEGQAGLWHS